MSMDNTSIAVSPNITIQIQEKALSVVEEKVEGSRMFVIQIEYLDLRIQKVCSTLPLILVLA